MEFWSLALALLHQTLRRQFLRVGRVPLRGNNTESITQRKLLNLRVTFFPVTAQRGKSDLFYNTSHPLLPPGRSGNAIWSSLHMVLLEFGVLGNKGFVVGILAGFGQSRSRVSCHQASRIRNKPSK